MWGRGGSEGGELEGWVQSRVESVVRYKIMELQQLRYFHGVAWAGSFTGAAEELGIGQPSLSQQIRVLEKSIGTPLFERLGRSLRLTAFGEALLEPAQRILQDVARAESSLANLREGVRALLRIG